MPKDEWLRVKNRDIARKASRETGPSSQQRRKKKSAQVRNQKRKQRLQANSVCPSCVTSFMKKSVRTFKNGTMHVEVRCATCDRFIKWGD